MLAKAKAIQVVGLFTPATFFLRVRVFVFRSFLRAEVKLPNKLALFFFLLLFFRFFAARAEWTSLKTP
jgi:hypothetical protein